MCTRPYRLDRSKPNNYDLIADFDRPTYLEIGSIMTRAEASC